MYIAIIYWLFSILRSWNRLIKLRFFERIQNGWSNSSFSPMLSHTFYVIFYFQKCRTLVVIKYIKLGIIQLLMICSIQFHPNKIRNCHGKGMIALFNWNAYFVNFLQCILYCINCQLAPFAAKCLTLTGSASIQDWYHLVEEACVCVILAEQIL